MIGLVLVYKFKIRLLIWLISTLKKSRLVIWTSMAGCLLKKQCSLGKWVLIITDRWVKWSKKLECIDWSKYLCHSCTNLRCRVRWFLSVIKRKCKQKNRDLDKAILCMINRNKGYVITVTSEYTQHSCFSTKIRIYLRSTDIHCFHGIKKIKRIYCWF